MYLFLSLLLLLRSRNVWRSIPDATFPTVKVAPPPPLLMSKPLANKTVPIGSYLGATSFSLRLLLTGKLFCILCSETSAVRLPNQPFLSCLLPLCQNESWCETIHNWWVSLQVDISCKSCSFSYERFCIRTRFETEARANSGPLHTTPEEFENCVFTLKTHQQRVHTTTRQCENLTITGQGNRMNFVTPSFSKRSVFYYWSASKMVLFK